MTGADLLARHADLWDRATRHPFLDGVREGTLGRESFDRWLVQDHLFVEALLRSQAGILAGAPRGDFTLLAGGVSALVDELGWFESVASARGLDLPGHRLPAMDAYAAMLLALPTLAYPAAVAALWAIERAYLDAWQIAAPGSTEYQAFVEHWTTPQFAEYVLGLEAAADRALADAGPAACDAASDAVAEVARQEATFWDMAF